MGRVMTTIKQELSNTQSIIQAMNKSDSLVQNIELAAAACVKALKSRKRPSCR